MFRKSLFLIPMILVVLTLIGSLGFMLIEGLSFFESLYMTVITLTTVGYREINTLSETGMVFNMLLIISGVFTMTYAGTKFITEVKSIDFKKRREEKMKKKIEDLQGHTIVCGFGRMGAVICDELHTRGVEFVVIEKRPVLVEELRRKEFLFIEGDAAHDDNIISANVKNAKVLISVIDNDSDGLYISLAARSMNEKLYIITRANEKKAKKRMIKAGANKVILPFVMSGQKVAESVVNPASEDFFDLTGSGDTNGNSKIQLADLFVKSDSTIVNKSINDCGPEIGELIIVGIRNREKDEFTFKPNSSYVFKEGDCLVTMGTKDSYLHAKDHCRLSNSIPATWLKT